MKNFLSRFSALLVSVLSAFTLGQSQPLDTLWTRIIGGWEDDICFDAIAIEDGFVLGGRLSPDSNTSYPQATLLKVSGDGLLQWSETYDILESSSIYSVCQTLDGGFISTCGSGGILYLVKSTEMGQLEWSSRLPLYLGPWYQQAFELSAGGYLVALSGGTSPSADIHLLRHNMNGDTVWSRAFGGPRMDIAVRAFETDSRGFMLLGAMEYSRPEGGFLLSPYVLRVDSNGIEEWSRRYHSLDDRWVTGADTTTDGGFYLCGAVISSGPFTPFCMKIGWDGDSLWTLNLTDYPGMAVADGVTLSDGTYIMSGAHSNGIILFHVDTSGVLLATRQFVMPPTAVYTICKDQDDLVLTAGYRLVTGQNNEIFAMAAQVTTSASDGPAPLPRAFDLLQNYPNPFNASTIIPFQVNRAGWFSLSLYNSLGQRLSTVYAGFKTEGVHTASLDATTFPSGTLFYVLRSGDQSQTKILTVVR